MLEKTLESPLDCKEIQQLHPKGNQSWIFIGKTDAGAEAPILWPPDVKNWLVRKDPEAKKGWRQEEKEMTENEMVRWHHRLNWHEFEQALGIGDGQGSLACCNPWGGKELDTTEWLNWTQLSCTLVSWTIKWYNSSQTTKGCCKDWYSNRMTSTNNNENSLLSACYELGILLTFKTYNINI